MNPRLSAYILVSKHLPWLQTTALKYCFQNANEFINFVSIELGRSLDIGYSLQMISLLTLLPETVLAANKVLASMLQRLHVSSLSSKGKLKIFSEVLIICGGWRAEHT